MRTIKVLLMFVIMIFIVQGVQGSFITDAHNITMLNTGDCAASPEEGMRILAKQSFTLINITKGSSSGCNIAFLRTSSGVQLRNASFSGNNANLNYSLIANTHYHITCDNTGGNYCRQINDSALVTYPKSGTLINWTGSISGGTNYTTYAFEIFNITGEVIDNFSVSALNVWNSSSISNLTVSMFNGTDTLNFSSSGSTVTTTILTNDTGLWNITVSNPYHFSNYTYNWNVSSTYQARMFQSVVNVTVRELFTNATISNFSINLTGFGVVINTSGDYGVIYPNNGSYNASVIDNSGADTFHTTSATFNVSFLDNKTVTLYVHQHYLIVHARDIQTNATINSFTINLTDLNLSTDNRQNATTNGNATFEVIHHSYNLTIVDAPGYAFSSSDGTFNQSQTVTISADTNVTFYLYKYNSVNFSFYDVDFPTTLLTTSNISMGLFYSANDSINYSTSVGWIFAENLTAGDWEARYSAPSYNPSNYFFTITESSTQRISLYLQNDSSTTLFKIILRDQNDDVVSNNVIRLQQQFALLDGQYVTIRECKTNEEGVCYMYIHEGIDTSYRFIVIDIDGDMIKTTDPAPIITLSSEDKVITIRVDTGSNLVGPLEQVLGIDAEITFSGNVSTFDFIDGYNAITGGCFKISRRGFVNSSYTILNYTCVAGTSGSISYNFSSSLENDSFLLFQGYVNYTNNQQLVAEQSKSNRVTGTSYDEDDNLFFILVLFCFLSFAMVFVPNIFIQILVDFGALIGVVWIGYTAIGIPIIMSFLTLGLFIAWDRKTARGFN